MSQNDFHKWPITKPIPIIIYDECEQHATLLMTTRRVCFPGHEALFPDLPSTQDALRDGDTGSGQDLENDMDFALSSFATQSSAQKVGTKHRGKHNQRPAAEKASNARNKGWR